VAAAASGVDLGRGGELESEHALQFGDVRAALSEYLERDPSRRDVQVTARLSPDRRTLTLTCAQTERLAFGAMFGKAGGVHHVVTASARVPVS
jgi:hypothetical protein